MILYTLAPLAESIFLPPEQQDAPESFTCSISGGLVQGVQTSVGIQVTRVISTDPKTYLSKEFDIGSILSFPLKERYPGEKVC